ncbi:MAG: diaminopimelate epimerase [Thiotrichaceae bacterium]
MLINFTKMHGLGNDFVVIDATQQAIDLTRKQVQFIANRRLGIGCDQLLLVEPADSQDVDFRYRIFNADGGEVEQCGNGARCFARFVQDQGLTDQQIIPVSTNTGRIVLQVMPDGQVQVDMGIPNLQPAKIPFLAEQQATVYTVKSILDGAMDGVTGGALDSTVDSMLMNTPRNAVGVYELGAVSVGNPHAVLLVDDVNTAPVDTVGPEIESHPRFPNRVNVGFMQVIDESNIHLRVYERGAGETMACGTGACAAVVSGILRGLLADKVIVNLPGGKLAIQWQGIGTPVTMTGPTETVFKGSMTL